jgi:hypothetical protein
MPRAISIVAARKFPNPRKLTDADIEDVIRQAFAGQPPRH